MKVVTSVLLLLCLASCTGDRFYKYCNVRIENQTESGISQISLYTKLGSSDAEVYNTSFEDLSTGESSEYRKVRCVSAVKVLMGNSEWIIISNCSVSYFGVSSVKSLVFEADTGTGNLDRALLQPDENYTIVVTGSGARVSSP